MATTQELENEIKKLKERNARVEADKKWETSIFRRAILALGIYVFAVVFLLIVKVPDPFLAALVPAIGFVFSTLTLPFLKNWWIEKQK